MHNNYNRDKIALENYRKFSAICKHRKKTWHFIIQKMAHDGINSYANEIKSNIKETESKIVNDVMFHYRNTIKQDPKTFGRITRVEWTKTEFWGVFRSGAFERFDYTLGVWCIEVEVY